MMLTKKEKNFFYGLPKELIIYIYSFDSTYKTFYNTCMNEMTKQFQINRINDRILGENVIYYLYVNKIFHTFDNLYGYKCNFSHYILTRIRTFGDQVSNERLKYHNLTKLKGFLDPKEDNR